MNIFSNPAWTLLFGIVVVNDQEFQMPSFKSCAFSLRPLATAAFALVLASGAQASHLNALTSVDTLDVVFAAGGGVYNGTLAGGGDDGYMAFQAAAGDVLSISMTSANMDSYLYLFKDNGGLVQVGDVVNITSDCTQGGGATVTFLACNDDGGGFLNSLISFNVTSTGQYLIGASSFNDSESGAYQITLSGNSLNVNAVPEPGSLALAGLALAGLGALSRRKLGA